MKHNKIEYKNCVRLKDGRTAWSCGFGYNYAIENKKSNITPVSEKYYNKVINSCRK